MSKKRLSDPLWYVDRPPPQLTKSQRTCLRILEAAIDCYASYGFGEATMERIAERAKISRPLVQHYFPDRNTLFLACARYIRVGFQRTAVEALSREERPEAQLIAYLQSVFNWSREKRAHAMVWMLFYYGCTHQKELKALNTELVTAGHKRITALIRAGMGTKNFRPGGAEVRAKMIQVFITGALISAGTEDLPFSNRRYEKHVQNVCLAIARGDSAGR